MHKPSLHSYIVGFISSLVLTGTAFFFVWMHMNLEHSWPPHPFISYALIGLALIQLLIQLIFFLHLGQGADGKWNVWAIVSTFAAIAVLVVGSLVIMHNINYNMSPEQMENFIIHDEGMVPHN